MNTILVTGGAGFIGSNFIRSLINTNIEVINLDLLTYASDKSFIESMKNNKNHSFIQGNICDQELISQILFKYLPNAIINFAAESHVDRSIDKPAEFINTNILGTYNLLNASTHYWQKLPQNLQKEFRFIHVSTDEVFGSLGLDGKFSETYPYNPRSPYSASKASSDHLVRSWYHTYKLPSIVTNCGNNYGPYQFPEKFIPLLIVAALNEKPLPIYGNGMNVRDWIHVEDHCTAIMRVLEKGLPGETYCIGGNAEKTNLEVAYALCDCLDSLAPNQKKVSHREAIQFVTDRPGHDFRYAMDTNKIEQELGWKPKFTFTQGIQETVQWYLANKTWWQKRNKNVYDGKRLGLIGAI